LTPATVTFRELTASLNTHFDSDRFETPSSPMESEWIRWLGDAAAFHAAHPWSTLARSSRRIAQAALSCVALTSE